MSHMNDLYVKLDVLETLVKTAKAKGLNGLSITIATNDEANQYGQNVSAWVTQDKDQRDKPKYYVGNGKVFWIDANSNVFKPERDNSNTSASVVSDAVVVEEPSDLPF